MSLKMLPFHCGAKVGRNRTTCLRSSQDGTAWGYEKRSIRRLSGGQRQRVAIARAIIKPATCGTLGWAFVSTWLEVGQTCRYELRELQQQLGICFVFVTHDQEEALAMSDWILSWMTGEIVQSGTLVDIYDEPINHFVATCRWNQISCRNHDWGLRVEFNGKRFEAVDGGMKQNEPVESRHSSRGLAHYCQKKESFKWSRYAALPSGVHMRLSPMTDGNEWMIPQLVRPSLVRNRSGLWTREDIHIKRLNETEEEFDARIEEYVETEGMKQVWSNAIERKRWKQPLNSL